MARPDRLVVPALGALWGQRGRLGFAWDVVRFASCNDCSLGSSGLSDGVVPGTHLCGRRLRRLAGVTADAIDPALLRDVSALPHDRRALRALGRLSTPMLRRSGAAGFTPIGWEDATHLAISRLRDARAGSAWSVRVNPGDQDLETLHQLARLVDGIERRAGARAERDLPALVDLIVGPAERALRWRCHATWGDWGSTHVARAVAPGDPVAVIARGDHPLLGDLIDHLRGAGVLAVRAEADGAWPDDVRARLVYGAPGVRGAIEVGLPCAREPATGEAIAALSALWLVGDATEQPVGGPPARIHQACFVDASMLVPASEAVVLLPAALPTEHPGGGTFLSDDGTLRFSPQVLGHDIPGALPGWDIAVRLAAHVDLDLAHALAAHDASELRTAIAVAHPRLSGVAQLGEPGVVAELNARLLG